MNSSFLTRGSTTLRRTFNGMLKSNRLASSPFFIPINAFFAKEATLPLVDNEYPRSVTFKDNLNLRDGLKFLETWKWSR